MEAPTNSGNKLKLAKLRKHKMATFKKCEVYRVRAGLEVAELAALTKKPGKSSIMQLENGFSIRAAGAHRIANTLNSTLKNLGLETFEVEKEVKLLT